VAPLIAWQPDALELASSSPTGRDPLSSAMNEAACDVPNLLAREFPAIAHIAGQLQRRLASERDPARAWKVWSRLVSDPRMDRVWRELYKHNKRTGKFLRPGHVEMKAIAASLRRRMSEIRDLTEEMKDAPADSRWNEQDNVAQLFFARVFYAALNSQPIFLSDLIARSTQLHDLAEGLRREAEIKRASGLDSDARTLMDFADEFDDEAYNILPSGEGYTPGIDDPWIVTRRRGLYEIRTFLADLVITAATLFKTPLYGTVATVANVALDREDITRAKVREMFRF
jgi:hypothetical protein